MHTKVEYKVKKDRGIAWEELPVHVVMVVGGHRPRTVQRNADVIGESLAQGENAIEVQWQFVDGCGQGHYIPGPRWGRLSEEAK